MSQQPARDATCPVCDARVAYGELCPLHRVLAERDVPEVLEKLTPPKDER